jgi:chromosome segregation ATPase
MSDAADRATLTAKLEQAQQRIAELEYSVRLLRGADETAESLAADLTRATQRVADLEQERDRFRAECEQLRSEWNTLAEQAERLTGANIVRTAELRFVIGEMHARVTELEAERDTARDEAAILMHAYDHGYRPSPLTVSRARSYQRKTDGK